jgi:small-conductance mechanosensitive channel
VADVNPVALLETLRSGLAQFASTEARLAATAALALLCATTATLVAPRMVRRLSREVRRRVLDDPRVPQAVDDARWLLPPSVLIRSLQAVVLAGTALAILVVWGREDVAVATVASAARAAPVVGRLLATAGLLAAAYVGTNVLEARLSSYAADSERINQHQQGIVFRVLQMIVLVAAGLGTLTVWDYNLDGLLVGAGFLGIVVGMAARQTLGSLIAGFVLMFSRPFEIGDWVEVDGEEGVVSDITIINTRLRNFDGETVVFPNDRVTNATITNRTKRDQLRLSVGVGVDYETDLELAEAVAEEAVANADAVANVPAPRVLPTTFGDSAVGLKIRFWIQNPSAPRRARARAAVVREVKAAFDSEGIKIPYPQRELLGREETRGLRVRPPRRADGDEGDGGDAADRGDAADESDGRNAVFTD